MPGVDLPSRYNATTDMLDRNLEEGRAAKVAIRTVDGQLTYAQVADSSNRFGNALRSLGVQMENRVLMAVLDSPEFAAAFFGAIKIGAVPVPVNTNLKPQDYAYFLNDSRARVAIVSQALADHFRGIRDQAPDLQHLVVIGEPAPGELAFAELLAGAPDRLSPANTSRDDMAFWMYSSGTTGLPKGAVHLQHDMRVCVDLYFKAVLNLGAEDTSLSVAKLYFAYGLGNALYAPFAVGGTTILHAGPPAPATMIDLVRQLRPTVYFAVPTSYANTLAAEPEVWAAADFSRVRICISAGEPLAGSILERWKARTGTDILDGIGSTEACHIFVSNRIGDIRPNSSGRLVEGYEARIVDEQGQDLPVGEVGTLLIKGDSTCAFYWNQHERSKRTIMGEWLSTGDQYRRDEEGYFTYQGRSDDMMKVGGIWVSPTEVEAAVNEHDAVLECAVVGVPDDQMLITPVAHVVLQPGLKAGVDLEEELRSFVRDRLAHYKCPRRYEFVEVLPKTATGKIQRFKLRDEAARQPSPASP